MFHDTNGGPFGPPFCWSMDGRAAAQHFVLHDGIRSGLYDFDLTRS
jgi:hypothetical protein